jgi:small-conductance mechanosensitive channel
MTIPHLGPPKIPQHEVVHFLRYVLGIIIVLVGATLSVIGVYYLLTPWLNQYGFGSLVDARHGGIAYLIVGVVAAILIIRILGSMIGRYVVPRANRTVGSTLVRAFYLFAAIMVLLGIFSFEGVSAASLAEILTTAGFLGIVLGLAAQTTIGNFFGAMAIIGSRPFDVGDRITFVSSSFAVQPTTYPHENQPSGYTGTVYDIGLIYTLLVGDDNVPLSVANGQLVQALIINHTRAGRRTIRLRLSAPKKVPLDTLKQEILDSLKGLPGVSEHGAEVRLLSMTLDGYDLVVIIPMEGTNEEALRSLVIERVLRLHTSITIPPE